LAQPVANNPYSAPEALIESQPLPVVDAPPSPPPARTPATVAWVSTTYFAEGLPYMVVRWLSGIYATLIGLPETTISSMNLLGIPWNFKFLWAPLVDWLSTKRNWLIRVQFTITVLCGVLALLAHIGPKEPPAGMKRVTWDMLAAVTNPMTGLSHKTIVVLILVVLALMAVAAATNDIAIDAFYMAGLPNKRDQAAYTGLRSGAYRVAMLFSKAALIGYAALSYGFAIAAVVMGLLTLFHMIALPQFETRQQSERPPFGQHLRAALTSYLSQSKIAISLVFIVCYKLGDELLFAMNSTFLLREVKVTTEQFKFLSVWIATPTAIGGTMAGAWLIKRYGLRRVAWPLTLAMSLTIWAYVWLAWAKPNPADHYAFMQICVIHGYEQIAAGLGSAVLTIFLVYTCKAEFKAAHFAIGSAIMSIGGTTLGSASGFFVSRIGYTNLYIAAFIVSLPALALLPYVPLEQHERQ
jgi:PAT family beta-lactamase induction signal transducer AmpG